MPPDENRNMLPQSDHDAIVRLGTITDRAITDIRDLHSGLSSIEKSIDNLTLNLDAKIAAAVASKIERSEVSDWKKAGEAEHTKLWKANEDMGKKVDWLTKIAYGGLGIIGFIQLLVSTGAFGGK